MKIISILFLAAVTFCFLLLFAICVAASKKPPMNPEDEKEFNDHDC